MSINSETCHFERRNQEQLVNLARAGCYRSPYEPFCAKHDSSHFHLKVIAQHTTTNKLLKRIDSILDNIG